MKIKEKPRKTKMTKSYMEWLGIELPKKSGRLSQLNKHNKRKPSEFILMVEKLEGGCHGTR